MKPSRARIEGYRNFGTKIWNAARFCEINECRADPAFDPATTRETVNRWILTEATRDGARASPRRSKSFRFNDAADALYHFVWATFCDWYLELIKPLLADGDGRGEGRDAGDRRACAEAVSSRCCIPSCPTSARRFVAGFRRARTGACSHSAAGRSPTSPTRPPPRRSTGWSSWSAPSARCARR